MMFKKMKGLLSLVICISMLCGIMPITSFAAEGDAASVTFNGSTEYYSSIAQAWDAAVALNTTAENKATIKLLDDCETGKTLANYSSYLVLDTNGKTLGTPYAAYPSSSVEYGIYAGGGSLEITGNGTISGISENDFDRAILLVGGGKVYVDGVTIHNNGTNGSNSVRVTLGELHLLDGYLLTDSEYALNAQGGNVYLYSGKIEGKGRYAMCADTNVQICYSEKPLYFVNSDTSSQNVNLISGRSNFHLEDSIGMNIEYSDNSDGSNSTLLENAAEISLEASTGKYLKIQTFKSNTVVSKLFDTSYSDSLLKRIKNDGVTDIEKDAITGVHFVDLANYDLTDVSCSDYSADSDGNVKAWINGTELYIGGYGKITAGESLEYAFGEGAKIKKISGLDMLDTSNVTNMSYMFSECGSDSNGFSLDLGNSFDTSNVTDMQYMFNECGSSQDNSDFTLNLGSKFDTSKVVGMSNMFAHCGENSYRFTLDLGDKFDTSNVENMGYMFYYCGQNDSNFTLNLGNKFNTSNVKYMYFMFQCCGKNSKVFTLDLGDKFNTSNVTDMSYMFDECGKSSEKFKELDLSGFNITVSEASGMWLFAGNIPVTRFIFGDGWANAPLPDAAVSALGGVFTSEANIQTDVIGATSNLANYDWTSDNRTVTFIEKVYYTITAEVGTDGGGTVSGGGDVLVGGHTTLVATANDGYAFDGWYDGDTKLCSTKRFTVENVTAAKTYTARFKEKIHRTSKLFSTDYDATLLSKAVDGGLVDDKTTIKAVSFVDINEYDLTEAVTVDYSADNDGSVLAWYDNANSELYIGGYEKIIAGSSLAYAFYYGHSIEAINGLDLLDTSNVTSMSHMFDSALNGMYSELKLGDNFDTSNVTDMSGMFNRCGHSTGFKLDLGSNFDTSKVTNMSYMFCECGEYSDTFALNLGDKFNTAYVRDMSHMFAYCGRYSENFTLDLGSGFDTSRVEYMSFMFAYCGQNGGNFTLNLGDKFNTTYVMNMSDMFDSCGQASDKFKLDLGNKFDTSSVTDMSHMFAYCGQESGNFTLNLGDNFDTYSVTDMSNMFNSCGSKSSAFTTLDLSAFTLSAGTNLSKFAPNIPVTNFIFGENWENAVLPDNNVFSVTAATATSVTGATTNLINYDWAGDNRTVTFTDKTYFTISAEVGTDGGGTVSGGGAVAESGRTTLTAAANDGYTFDGWYDGDTKVCETEEFVVNNVTADKTYTAKFTKNVSRLFNTSLGYTLLSKIKSDGTTDVDAITAVHFVDLADYNLTDVKYSDYSADGNGSVKAWMDGTELYIGGNGKIIAGESLKLALAGARIDSITGLEMLDTSNTKDMSSMFSSCGSRSSKFTLDLGDSFDTSNVTNMSGMFDGCGSYTGYGSDKGINKVFTLDLGENFNTSNVTNMAYMFNFCGTYSKVFTLDLGDKFDTSKVTNMLGMFRDCGYSNEVFTLDLGDKFDTSKVINMEQMFRECGYSSEVFTLDLGNKFDTSKVTKMGQMFRECLYSSEVFTLDLGENFNTSKVTDMSYMFESCGCGDSAFTLDLGNKFDTSKVTNMSYMFARCGNKSGTFATLDLSSFTINAGTDITQFAQDTPVTTFIFGEGWANAALPQAGSSNGAFYTANETDTTVVGATENLINYDWAEDNRAANELREGIYIITAKAETGGTVTGGGEVAGGGNITLNAAADDGYTFEGWYTVGEKAFDTAEISLQNVTKSKIYTAKFTETIYYTISAEVGTDGGGTVSGGGAVAESSSITLTAAANDGYTFDGWYDGDTKVCDTVEFVVENVTADKTYIAKFIKNVSRLFGTSKDNTLLTKIKNDGVTEYSYYEITGVYFVDLADYDLTDITYSDYSANGDGSVKAWMKGSKLYIGGNGKIIAGESLSYAFYNGSNIDSIAGLEMLDTSNTKNMSYMFAVFGGQNSKSTLDLGGNFDTSNVTDMSHMFDLCGGSGTGFTLDLGDKFNTSKVTDMSYMFYRCGYWSEALTLDLGVTFDTSNVTNMSFMFSECGVRSDKFTLNLGGNFDTSNVTDISYMFCNCGSGSEFTLDLGDKFNTINVTNMEGMFFGCGSKVFTLNLGDNFDTSNVTNMSSMFRECGYNSNVFTLNLGNKFDTSKVKNNMYRMFYRCGYNSNVFTLDLGDTFDTSNVINMGDMFYECGYSSKVFTLDLGDKFDTSNVIKMGDMFYGCGYNSDAFKELDLSSFTVSADTDINEFAKNTPVTTFIFGEGWANATLPSAGSSKGAFYTDSQISTSVIGATPNLINYDWASDNRTVTFTDKSNFKITANAQTGGTVSGGGTVTEGGSITLNATADDGYTFDGWYDGDTKVCDTAEFVVSNVIADKTYTARFTKNVVYYTISAEVGTDGGGTVSGGGTVVESSSVTLTAAANDGYTFDGWYDGDTKVCDTAEFVVSNVTEDKTYTAKFTKNQVDPEPEEPEIPYLKWDGTTLTLVKKASASCRVVIAYVGGATFDPDNINWDELVAAGKDYANLNSALGYAVYNNFTKRTPGTRGNYVAFVKYTKDDGTTKADYITFSVKNAVSFERPALSYNAKTKTLKMTGNVPATVGVAYVGDAVFDANNVNWDDFVATGKKYPNLNGSSGFARITNTLDYTKTFRNNGNYVAYIKYFDENLNKTLAKYYTFTVDDYNLQPTDVPFAVAEESEIVLTTNGYDVTKVTIVYIGTEDIRITNWNEFANAAAKYQDINGKLLDQQYANPKDGSAWTQKNGGWYGVYIRYNKDGERCTSYYTVEVK